MAALVGASLAISGAIYQGIFNNKLVSPDLLGVSTGAGVGACFGILLGLSTLLINIHAFAMGFIAVLLSIAISKSFHNKSNVVLLLSGIAVGGLMTSLIGLMKYLADNEIKLAEMTFWLLGDLSQTSIIDVLPMTIILAIFGAMVLFLAWDANIVSMGEKESRTLGVNYRATIMVLIISATALTAGAVAVSGTIGWIGLVIPNIVRLIVGSDNRAVFPISALIGASFLIVVDTLARSISPNEIPLSVITGIIGTPLFIYAIHKKRRDIRRRRLYPTD
jgi:iron complex transport system permease protein